MMTLIHGPFVLAEDTLLLYTGREETAVVPAQVEGHTVRRIGSGAFNGGPGSPLRLFLEEGIEEIGADAFDRRLEAVHLPSTLHRCEFSLDSFPRMRSAAFSCTFSGDAFREKRKAAACLSGGRFYIRHPQIFPELEEKVRLLGIRLFPVSRAKGFFFAETNFLGAVGQLYRKPRCFPIQILGSGNLLSAPEDPEMPGYPGREADPGPGMGSSYRALQGKELSEAEAVRALIAGGGTGCLLSEEEAAADWSFRGNEDPNIHAAESYVISFAPEDISRDGLEVTVSFSADRAFYFFPQAVRITDGAGEDRYLYSRVYPFPEQTLRVDMAVFDGKGRMLDEKTARKVYMRYKLLSLI